MAMDRQQEIIDDYMNYDQEGDEVKRRIHEIRKNKNNLERAQPEIMKKIKEDLYIENWPMEDRDREARRRFKELENEFTIDIDEIKQEVRQEALDNMEFNRRVQQERHLDDLEEQQRRYDAERYQEINEHMLDRWWNERQQMRSEAEIYNYDIDGMNPNNIVENYHWIAQLLNISDTNKMKDVIDRSQNAVIDGNAFRELVGNEEGKQMVDKIMQENNGNLDINSLMDHISQFMRNNADQRIETEKGYMDAAEKNLEARAKGIERKIDAFNKVSTTSLERDKAFFEIVDTAYSQGRESARKSEEEIMKKISLSEIEKATDSVRTSEISDNINDITRQNQRERDEEERV